MAKTALILGAGIGGIVAARTLRKLLPPEHRVVVVERQREHVFAPSLLWYMTGDHTAAKFTRPLSTLSPMGIELVQGDITGIDPAALSVEVGGQTLRGDAMVLALGADYAPELIPGLAEVGHNLYTLDGAAAIGRALQSFQGGRIVVLTAAPAYKCPAAPYEAAMLLEAHLKKRGLRERSEVVVHAAEPIPMAVTGPAIGEQVKLLLHSKGIGYFPNHQVSRAEAGLLHFSDGGTAPFDLLLYVPPHRVPAVVKAAGLCGESGWVAVDRGTLQTKFDQLYAIGDVTSIPLKMGRPLPKAGVFAHGQAEVVAHNIAHAWSGQGAPRQFAGEGMCFLEIGDARAGLGQGNFYAEPTPQVAMRGPSVLWHAGKVMYEKYWLYRYL